MTPRTPYLASTWWDFHEHISVFSIGKFWRNPHWSHNWNSPPFCLCCPSTASRDLACQIQRSTRRQLSFSSISPASSCRPLARRPQCTAYAGGVAEYGSTVRRAWCSWLALPPIAHSYLVKQAIGWCDHFAYVLEVVDSKIYPFIVITLPINYYLLFIIVVILGYLRLECFRQICSLLQPMHFMPHSPPDLLAIIILAMHLVPTRQLNFMAFVTNHCYRTRFQDHNHRRRWTRFSYWSSLHPSFRID